MAALPPRKKIAISEPDVKAGAKTSSSPRKTAVLVGKSTRTIGVHLGIAGGTFKAAERAHAISADTFQIFSSSPRMWRATTPSADHCTQMRVLRDQFGIKPAVIHTSYLVNLASVTDEFREKSIVAFRGEVERALALGAEYLVLHPGSWKGLTRERGLERAADGIRRALQGLAWDACDFRILIENTAGSEYSLGGSLEQVGELIETLRAHAPVGACLDTCHTHVAGYDIVTPEGYAMTMQQIEETIGSSNVHVWHMNDAKAPRGSKLDRHEYIGQGTIGTAPFQRLLHDKRFAHCAFIAETPVDEPEDNRRTVATLRALATRDYSEGIT
jgi:deoxyribonuclease-4